MLRSRAPATYAHAGALAAMDDADRVTAEALHDLYLDDVFRYVVRRVSRIEEAEDITAEVFAAAAAGLPRFRGQCRPYLWVLGIARRKIADNQRRRSARRETLASELPGQGAGEHDDPLWETLVAVEGPEAAVVRAEARRVIRDLIAHLSSDQREAVLLRYMERLPVVEVAVVMGRTATSVTGLLQRARETLFRRGRGYFLGEDEEHER